MFALFGNFDLTELIVIAGGAVIVFGKRLPEVAIRAAAHIARLRRQVTEMWRQTGLDQELKRVRRDIDRELSGIPNPRNIARDAKAKVISRIDPGNPFDDATSQPVVEPVATSGPDPEPRPPASPDSGSDAGASGSAAPPAEATPPAPVAPSPPTAPVDRREPPPSSAPPDPE